MLLTRRPGQAEWPGEFALPLALHRVAPLVLVLRLGGEL
jgi:hypothetical protein